MQLYHESGFANIPEILKRGMPFNFVIGGRGTGKTYGALKEVAENDIRFCLMRRTQAQLDTIARVDTNPFKSGVRDLGVTWSIDPVPAGKNVYAYKQMYFTEDGSTQEGRILGYAIALSTVANLRGFDMSDVELLIYDEFIPESHERAIKNESDAFLNCYETINRNRELQGRKPLQVLCLANSNDFACPILVGLGLVGTVEKMIAQGKTEYVNPQKGIGIFLLTDSPVSARKETTALYRLTHGTAFHDMAIKNAFAGSEDPDVYSVDLREYAPVVSVGELCVYKHKATNIYYVSSHTSGAAGHYSGDGVDMKRFFATHRLVVMAAICGRIVYESHFAKALFLRYCGLN